MIKSRATKHCDVARVDYAIRGKTRMEGLALLGYLRRTFPKVGIIARGPSENPMVIRSILDRNVASVVSKFDDVGHIVRFMRVMAAGTICRR